MIVALLIWESPGQAGSSRRESVRPKCPIWPCRSDQPPTALLVPAETGQQWRRGAEEQDTRNSTACNGKAEEAQRGGKRKPGRRWRRAHPCPCAGCSASAVTSHRHRRGIILGSQWPLAGCGSLFPQWLVWSLASRRHPRIPSAQIANSHSPHSVHLTGWSADPIDPVAVAPLTWPCAAHCCHCECSTRRRLALLRSPGLPGCCACLFRWTDSEENWKQRPERESTPPLRSPRLGFC